MKFMICWLVDSKFIEFEVIIRYIILILSYDNLPFSPDGEILLEKRTRFELIELF
jgi:hypothetical protein